MAARAVFAGKYAFQATDAGPANFLTVARDERSKLPALAAATMTATELACLYATADGDYLVALPVPQGDGMRMCWCRGHQQEYVTSVWERELAQPFAIPD